MIKKVSAQELLKLLPEEELKYLAAETKVNYQVKKLSGEIMFKLLLFSLLEHEKASLRIMEELFTSMRFRLTSGQCGMTTKFNCLQNGNN
jgi:hypothetical protein